MNAVDTPQAARVPDAAPARAVPAGAVPAGAGASSSTPGGMPGTETGKETETKTETKTVGIEVTPKAVEAIRAQMLKRDRRRKAEVNPAAAPSETALRLGIKGGGCSGFSYVIEFHDGPPRARDRVFDYTAQDGTPIRVVVDPKSLVYLNGTMLDWEQTLMNQGFKFRNPQEKSNCGCGHSFTV